MKKDIDRVADIWLDTNIKSHNFISSKYWEDNYQMVKELFPCAEVFVYEEDKKGEIQGFIGLCEDYIEGLFVWEDAQSSGFGKQLLDYVKTMKKRLTLSVYQKNIRAIKFYQREHFEIECEKIDENTGENEYIMIYNL
jgi:putative acetyltransferase